MSKKHVTKQNPAEFEAETKRRRETARPVTNFLIDGENGVVLLSSNKTAEGIQLLTEDTFAVPFPGFVAMVCAFIQTTIAPQTLGIPAGGGGNGNPG
jgi:hypothetical protein